MLQPIARGVGDESLDGLLRACHERIRKFGAMAVKLAQAPGEDGVAEAAAAVRRYFAEALPLHVADEELSITPRLRGRDVQVDAALVEMTAQHEEHHALITHVIDLCAAIAAAPARRGELAVPAAALVAAMDLHLAAEESTILPAVAALPAAQQAEILDELRGRRAPPPPQA